jgi:5-methylcytosine-specific restriction endonuclease McrA
MADDRLSKQENAILELLIRSAPTPLTEGEMRVLLAVPTDEQAQFGRRRRELNRYYRIEKVRHGRATAYVYRGPLEAPKGARRLNNKLKFEIIARDGKKCQWCGASPAPGNSVELQVDHKIPGGPDTADNLWTLCRDCNHGKKDQFKNYDLDPAALASVIGHTSVHVRIGELLKRAGKPVPASLIAMIANQDDWKKRLRELRYLDWEIEPSRTGRIAGRVQVTYRLVRWTEWPDDPSQTIRAIEKQRSREKRQD